ncbi:Hsp20/alpha crystallin family protein [bacterium]|nr:MAG: Hsp20/alpha crystallin family protein [bacterium]
METKTFNEVKTDQRDVVKHENGYYYVQPRCDIRESKDHYHLLLEMPGVNKDTLSVQVKNGQLLIEGKMNIQEEGELIRSEIYKRNYRRIFTLGKTVDTQNIDASWKNGFLQMNLTKKEEAKPREIKINFN